MVSWRQPPGNSLFVEEDKQQPTFPSLLERARSGEAEAISTLYRRFLSGVFWYIAARVPDRDIAKDIFIVSWSSQQPPKTIGILNPDGTVAQTTTITFTITNAGKSGNGKNQNSNRSDTSSNANSNGNSASKGNSNGNGNGNGNKNSNSNCNSNSNSHGNGNSNSNCNNK